MRSSRNALVGTVVWGSEYIELFEQINIPSLLSSRNLPALWARRPVRFLVVTTPPERDRIACSAALQHIARQIPVEVHSLDMNGVTADKYRRSSLGQSWLIGQAARQNAWLIMNAPDGVYGNGTYSTFDVLFDKHYRMIATSTLQTDAHSFPGAFRECFSGTDVEPGPLVRLALDHPHPGQIAQNAEAADFTTWPSALNWLYPKVGLLIRSFHAAIVAIRPDACMNIDNTIDGSFANRFVKSMHDIYLPQDSMQICVVNINRNAVVANSGAAADPDRVAKFMERWAMPVHHHFVNHPYRAFHRNGSEAFWKLLERKSSAFIANCEQALTRHAQTRPARVGILYRRGVHHLEKGDYGGAFHHFFTAAGLAPHNDAVLTGLARCLHALPGDEARRCIETLQGDFQIAPQVPSILAKIPDISAGSDHDRIRNRTQ